VGISAPVTDTNRVVSPIPRKASKILESIGSNWNKKRQEIEKEQESEEEENDEAAFDEEAESEDEEGDGDGDDEPPQKKAKTG